MRKFLKKFFCLSIVVLLVFTTLNLPLGAYAQTAKELLYVNFDGNVEDHSGNGNKGTVYGNPSYVEGIRGKALHIVNDNGSSSTIAKQYVDFGNKETLAFTNQDFALSFWYKSDNGVSAGGALISNKNFDSGANPGFAIGNFDTGLRVNFTPVGEDRYDVYNFAPIDGIWHHVAINFDRDKSITTYLDNQLVGETDISASANKSIDVANFVVGADGRFKNGLNDAYIDELKVFQGTLSTEEIDKEYSLNDDEVLHLTFNGENVNDTSGNNNHGKASNVTYDEGIDGKAAHIINENGTTSEVASSYIDFGSQIDLGKEDFTISFWYKTSVGNENGGTIIANKDYSSGANDGFAIGSFTNEIRANLAFANERKDLRFTPVDGSWHHNVVTFDRDGNMTTYTDGEMINTIDISAFANDDFNLGNIVIGADKNYRYGLLDSSFDEVRIFKSVKSSWQIKRMYELHAGNVDASGDVLLEAHFDGDAKDTSGNGIDGVINGNVSFVNGIKGKAAHIVNTNGSTSEPALQYIDFGKQIKFKNNDFALSFWYSSDNGVSNGGALISNKDFDSGANPGFNIGNFNTGLRANFATEGGSRKDIYNFAPIDGKWHYVVINFDRDDKMVAYVDGQEIGATDISSDKNNSLDVANLVIGADGYFENGVNDAYVDEFVVYSHLINDATINDIYQQDYLQYTVTSAKSFYDEAIKNVKYDKDKLASLNESILVGQEAIATNDYQQVDTIIAAIEANLAAVKEGVTGVVDGQMLYLSFDQETTNDDSGRENHGTSVGNISYADGVIGKAVHIQNDNGSTFDQAKQYINFGQVDDLKFKTDDFAISFWYKTVDGGGREAAIISNKDWSSGSNKGMTIGNFGNSMRVNYTGEDCSRDDIYGLSVNDDRWHYIVVNFDRDNNIDTYIDGEYENSVDISDTYGKSIDDRDFVIGADGNKIQGLDNAYLDEVRVLKRLFTKDEIEAYYLPYRLNMKLVEYREALQKAKDEGYDENKIAEFEKVLTEVEQQKDTADGIQMKKLIKKLTNAFDRFQIKETPIISFHVLADVHIDGTDANNKSRINLIDALDDLSVLDPTSSAVLFPGDFTDSGTEEQYGSFYDILKNHNYTRSIVALGNHDVRWLCSGENLNEPGPNIPTCKYGTSAFEERYLRYNLPFLSENTAKDKLYFDEWIKGYHFITLNTEQDLKDNAYLSDEQLSWLERILPQDARPDKPIFIQIHQAFTGNGDHEYADLIGEQEEKLKDILRKYPQAVVFTGHVHNGLDIAKVYHEEYGHIVDVPSFKYQAYGDARAQIGYQVNIFENRVQVRPRDFKNDLWLDEYTADFKLTEKTNDYTQLEKAIKEAEELVTRNDLYTEASLAQYAKVLQQAKDLLSDATANQTKIDAMTNDLIKAKEQLVAINDKTLLAIAISTAKAVTPEQLDKLIPVVKAEFEQALTEAQNTYDDKTATQDKIDAAFMRLAKAMHMLEFVKGDKAALETLINEVKALNSNNYTVDSWEKLSKELSNAVTVYNDVNAMQKEVDETREALQAAKDALVKVDKVDKSKLQAFYNRVKDTNLDKYLETTRNAFKQALSNANTILISDSAIQADIDQAYSELVKAYLDLRLIPDKGALEELLNQATMLQSDLYTSASWQKVADAMNKAQAVLKASASEQSQVDQAYYSLNQALQGLVKRNQTPSVATGDMTTLTSEVGLLLVSLWGILIIKNKMK